MENIKNNKKLIKNGHLFILIGTLLIAGAVFIMSRNAYLTSRAESTTVKVYSELYQRISEKTADSSESAGIQGASGTSESISDNGEIEYPNYVLNPKMNMPTEVIDRDSYIGILSIPSIGKELPVLETWSYVNLNKTPCCYSGTAYNGNFVICGHNYRAHFGRLEAIGYGDVVTFTDCDGNVFEYTVEEIETIEPTAIEEMTQSGWDLTLFTCNASGFARVAVRCMKTDNMK